MSNDGIKKTTSTADAASLEKFGYEQTLNRRLNLGNLLLFGATYMAPFTLINLFGLVEFLTHGMMALSYIIATIAMLLTAISYGKLAAAYPIAGSVYTYTQRSMNPYAGFMAGWSILMDYILIPMLTCVIGAMVLKVYVPAVPSFVWILLYAVIATLLNYFGISVTAMVGNVMGIAQLGFIIALVIMIIGWITGGNGAATFADPTAIFNAVEFENIGGMSGIVVGASILAMCFLGFDAVTTLSEETIRPEKTVGRAVIIICLGMGLVFTIGAYFMHLAWPNGWQEFENMDTGGQELVVLVGGNILSYLFITINTTASLANIVVSQTSAARILYGMGRDGALPKKIFAYVHPKRKVPTYNLFIMGAIALTAVFLDLDMATSLVNFGALIGFVFVNLSVTAHYFVKEKRRGVKAIILYIILPLLGAVICGWLWWGLATNAKIIGGVWVLLGFICLAFITRGFKHLPPDMKMSE